MQLASTKRSHPCTRKMSAGVKAKVVTALSVWAGWLLCSLLLHRLLPASASFSFFLDTCAWHCLIFYKLVFEQPATPLGTALAFLCCLKTFYLFPSLLCPLSSSSFSFSSAVQYLLITFLPSLTVALLWPSEHSEEVGTTCLSTTGLLDGDDETTSPVHASVS